VGGVHQAGPDLQRRAEVHAAGPCLEKTRTGCCPGVEPRCDAQPAPDRREVRRSSQAAAEGRPASHRHHLGGATASGGPDVGWPVGWSGGRSATGLPAVRRGRAVHPCGQGTPDLAGPLEATALRRSTAQQVERRSNHQPGRRPVPPPWRRHSWLPRRWCQRREPALWRQPSSPASWPAAARSPVSL
jgi:hypothetical protein